MWGNSDIVIKRTLELFNDLTGGYSALKSVRKLEATHLIMQNHLSSDFTFLSNDKHKRSRMLYYQILCKILFADDNCEREFFEFMKPFEARLDSLSMLNTIEEFQQPDVQVKSALYMLSCVVYSTCPIACHSKCIPGSSWLYSTYSRP